MRTADLLIKCLENEGVEYIFGVPGEENIAVMDALLDSKIQFIVTRHETGAAFMAGMMGRLTGKPGVCLATLGPGATNMLTGVADANMDRSPIVAITGQAGLNRQHKASHQAYDVVSMYEPVTKWNAAVKTPETIPEIVRKAFQVAKSEKPGATHIELPEDVAGMDVDGDTKIIQSEEVTSSVGKEGDIQKAASLINNAQSPLIIVGNGVTRTHATNALIAFAEKIQAPVTETFMGKGSMPNDHPLYTMTTGLFEKDYISCAYKASDLIISIGYDMTELPPENWNHASIHSIIHIDSDNAEVDAHYPVIQSVIGSVGDNLLKLTNVVKGREEPPSYLENLKAQINTELSIYRQDQSFPMKPQKIIYDIRDVMKPGDMTLSDVGAHKMWMARMYSCYEPNTCLISNGLASMGFALPSAIAAKMVDPEKKVIAVIGDGGFLMSGFELETAVRLKLNIVILVWRDDGYGLIEWKQRKAFERTSHITFGNPSFVKLAEAFGAKGFQVQQAKDLKDMLIKGMNMSGPVVIECPVDYGENMNLTEFLGKMECKIDD